MPYEDVFDRTAVQSWSEAKVQAWRARLTSPNDYLLRFPAPGERQATGQLAEDEVRTFNQRHAEFQSRGWPLSACWGIFSLALPNRTGQQCAAHYRKVISGSSSAAVRSQGPKAAVAAAAQACVHHHHPKLDAMWASPSAQRLAHRVDARLAAAGLGTAAVLLAKPIMRYLQPLHQPVGHCSKQNPGSPAVTSAGQALSKAEPRLMSGLATSAETSMAAPDRLVVAAQARDGTMQQASDDLAVHAVPNTVSVIRPHAVVASRPRPDSRVQEPASAPFQATPCTRSIDEPLSDHSEGSGFGIRRGLLQPGGTSTGQAGKCSSSEADNSKRSGHRTCTEALQPALNLSAVAPPAKVPKLAHNARQAGQHAVKHAIPFIASAALQPITNRLSRGHQGTARLTPAPAKQSDSDSSEDEDFVEGSMRRSIQAPVHVAPQPASVAAPKRSMGLKRSRKQAEADQDGTDVEFGHQVTAIRMRDASGLPGWAPRSVQPYQPATSASVQLATTHAPAVHLTDALLGFDLAQAGGDFLGVLMNPPVVSGFGNGRDSMTSTQLASLSLGDARLIFNGLLFIWASKACLAETVRCMALWGFKYVENLTWLQTGPNGQPLRRPSPALGASHLTLLIGRKGTGNLELRHQRSPDVIIGPVPAHGLVPEAVYQTIETLLPEASPELASVPLDGCTARLLELRWGSNGHREVVGRSGWTLVVQSKEHDSPVHAMHVL